MEEPQELSTAATLSSLPSIWVTLDNSRTENRRGVAHARLLKKIFHNYDATIIMGHRVGLDKNEARLVGDRGQPSDKSNAILKGWHDMRPGNHWVSGDNCYQIRCERDTAWSCQVKIN